MAVAFSRVLKRQAGATAKELIVIAALFGVSLAFMVGAIGFGVYMTTALYAH